MKLQKWFLKYQVTLLPAPQLSQLINLICSQVHHKDSKYFDRFPRHESNKAIYVHHISYLGILCINQRHNHAWIQLWGFQHQVRWLRSKKKGTPTGRWCTGISQEYFTGMFHSCRNDLFIGEHPAEMLFNGLVSKNTFLTYMHLPRKNHLAKGWQVRYQIAWIQLCNNSRSSGIDPRWKSSMLPQSILWFMISYRVLTQRRCHHCRLW